MCFVLLSLPDYKEKWKVTGLQSHKIIISNAANTHYEQLKRLANFVTFVPYNHVKFQTNNKKADETRHFTTRGFLCVSINAVVRSARMG